MFDSMIRVKNIVIAHVQVYLTLYLFLNNGCVTGSIINLDNSNVKVAKESLDPSGKYLLSWTVDLAKGSITFEAEVETKGYVGFGISQTGGMLDADIFLAGVSPEGQSYGYDMHSSGPGRPTQDKHSDWELIDAQEDDQKTYLKFSRLLNTCDEEDYPISNDTVRLIWSIGETDKIEYHAARGTKSVNLLMPDPDDFNGEDYLQWDLENEITMPPEDTTYWCSVQKAPFLTTKHHIVAFEPLLNNELALNHTHHFVIYKCIPPEGVSAEEAFEKFVGHPGENCYLKGDQQPMPVEHCLGIYMYVWSKGGKRMVFPNDLGYPFPENVDKNNYYMLEVHYDNPHKLSNVTFRTGARVSYTNVLRSTDAGLLTLGYDVGVYTTIPPNQEGFVVAGNCGSDCTADVIPDDGIKVFNSLLHSHLSGKKMKVRQFRGDKELPWLDVDDHYDFNFQQNKALREYIPIFPGDHLTVECTYNTTWNGGKVVVGGLSTQEEMCMAFLWYYPKIDFEYCGSRYPLEKHFEDLGILEFRSEPVNGGLDEITIVKPDSLAGDFIESLSTRFNWSESFLKRYEDDRRYQIHEAGCGTPNYDGTRFVHFPDDFEKYVPEEPCKQKTDPEEGKDESENNRGGAGFMFQSSVFLVSVQLFSLFLYFDKSP